MHFKVESAIGLRGVIPDFLTIVVGNTLYLVWILLVWKSIRNFFNIKYPLFSAGIFLTTFIFIFSYFTVIEPDTQVRIILISLFLAIVAILSIRDLLRSSPGKKVSAEHWYSASALAVFAGFLLLRIFTTLFENVGQDFMSAGTIQQWSIMFLNFTAISFLLGFLWILHKDLEDRLIGKTVALEKSNAENTRMRDAAIKDSLFDPLTGAGNRRKLDQDIPIRYSPYIGREKSLSVAFIDIDHFKQINDDLGHDYGDTVLKSLADLIMKNIRSIDAVYRLGGEEFLIFMPDTNSAAATRVCERLRQQVEQEIKTDNKAVTVSIGVTDNRRQDSIEELMEKADKLMYQAKKTTRNRVVSGP